MSATDAIHEIYAIHRKRCYMMAQRIRIGNALGAFIRIQMGWNLDKPEAERARIKKAAQKLIASGGGEYATLVGATGKSAEVFEKLEAGYVKQMEKLAKQLPAWEAFAEPVRGFGLASLATIVGEAGDISNYPTVAKLWKRMGLAVMNGVRQGGLPKGAPAESWIEHGYNRKRRSKMWQIGDVIIRAQVRKVEGNEDAREALGAYGVVYLERKMYEYARNPDIKPIAAHRRAQRYMEKRLLRDLWAAWRRCAGKLVEPNQGLRTDRFNADEQPARETKRVLEPKTCMSRALIPDADDESAGRTDHGSEPNHRLSAPSIPVAGKPARKTRSSVKPNPILSCASNSGDEPERQADHLLKPNAQMPAAPIMNDAHKAPRRTERGMKPSGLLSAAPTPAKAGSRATKHHLKPSVVVSRGKSLPGNGSRKADTSVKPKVGLPSGKSSRGYASP